MDWKQSIKLILDNSPLRFNKEVQDVIIENISYNFFFLTNIDLSMTRGKIYFGGRPSAENYDLESGIIIINTSITILLSSYPLSLKIQKKFGEFKVLKSDVSDPLNIFAFLDDIDPRSIYSKYTEKSYIPNINSKVDFDLEVDSLFFESVYLEFELNFNLKELKLILKLVELIDDYDQDGKIHNHTIKLVTAKYVQYYIDFGSSMQNGLDYIIVNLAKLDYIKKLRISSYPTR